MSDDYEELVAGGELPLSQIGFYTLTDERAKTASASTRLSRCEVILTERCNFRCAYCRELREDCQGDLGLEEAKFLIDIWANDGLYAIRFSGGEPTVYQGLEELIGNAKTRGVERIAISTNGSAQLKVYERLVKAGVNDFSISLDACCSSEFQKMAGVNNGEYWSRLVSNLFALSRIAYITVGVVVDDNNLDSISHVVQFAHSLGVSDIRVIPSAQYGDDADVFCEIPKAILSSHPILRYRVARNRLGMPVRGIGAGDCHRCPLVLDDMAVAGGHHFPCVIYLREGGDPIGKVGPAMRAERQQWFEAHDTHQDRICANNCLDVCLAYNNRWEKEHER